MLLQLGVALLQASAAGAVKSWMFKRCDQNPFCERNRRYADSPSEYFVDPASIDTTGGYVSGNVVKLLTEAEAEVATTVDWSGSAAVLLPFTLDFVSDEIVHFVVDEDRHLDLENKALEAKLNSKRFDPTEFVLNDIDRLEADIKVGKDALHIKYGNTEAVLQFSDVRIEVLHNGETQVVLNDRGLFNVEHLRRRRQNERNADWEDRFDKYTDVRVRGPESVAVDTSFVGYDHLYGIPEHADSLSLKDTTQSEPYRLFNVDIFEYETESPMPMYGAIPLVTAAKKDHAAAVFWLNAADTYVDVKKAPGVGSAHWMSETGKLDAYIIVDTTPSNVLRRYGLLTGAAQLPQQFALGYHQCRWNYQTQEELLGVNTKMDANLFPYDVIWLDLEWSDDRRYFAWNTETFPDSEGMMATLDETQRKLVVLNDPHIKAKADYEVYNGLRDAGVLMKDTDGERDFLAHCWPGESAWIDTLHPLAAEVWTKFHALGTKLGGWAKNLYIWSDMSEPSVFSGSETTAYKATIHYGGWQHRDVHNVYGHTVFNATHEALEKRYEGTQRPFILTRSFFAGSQKLGPTWTGDNQAEWSHLQAATPMLLTLNGAGYPFAGADVGGFFRNPGDELLVRWYQAGTFYPFFRAHAHVESRYREPYLLTGEWQDVARKAIELRYELLPELYTAFWAASVDLQPIMRPLYFDYPEDPALAGIDDEFFVGPSLLAKPVVHEGQKEMDIIFPGTEIYYDYFTGEPAAKDARTTTIQLSIDTVPLYVKGGSVVFRKDRRRRSSQLMVNDPYTLLIAVDSDGTATGRVYFDDGVSYAYRDAEYVLSEVSMQNGQIVGRVANRPNKQIAATKIERIIVYGAEAAQASVAGHNVDVIQSESGFILRNPGVHVDEDWVIKLSS